MVCRIIKKLPILTGFLLFLAGLPAQAAGIPAELSEALAGFRSDGPSGWSYLQTTSSAGETVVERFDPVKPQPFRWTLVENKGKTPTEEESDKYRQGKIGRSSTWNAPRLESQLDLTSCEIITTSPESLSCRFALKPDASGDDASKYLFVTLQVDRASKQICRMEISAREPFSPVFGIHIKESTTILEYGPSLPGSAPLLLHAKLHIRGRAFLIKSLDQDMDIFWTDYQNRNTAKAAAAAR